MKYKCCFYVLLSTILLCLCAMIYYYKINNKSEVKSISKPSYKLRKVIEICNELSTNDTYEYNDEDLDTLNFVIKEYKPKHLLLRFTHSYLFNRFNKVNKTVFEPVPVENEMNIRVTEYLKGDNLWKIDMSEERNLTRENLTKEIRDSQDSEVLDYLVKKSLPQEIEDILKTTDFRYKVDLFKSEKNVVNRHTYEFLTKKCKNPFIKKILDGIIVKEKEDGGLTKTEMLFFNEYASINFDFITGVQIKDPVILTCENVFVYRSEIRDTSFKSGDLNIYEIVFLRSIMLTIDDQYLTSIIDYLEIHLGIKIPDIFIDHITGRIIKFPVLLVEGENYFLDESTVRNHISEWNGLSPFTRSRIDLSVIQEFSESNFISPFTRSQLNQSVIPELDLSNETEVINEDLLEREIVTEDPNNVSDEVSDKTTLLTREIDNFMNRLPIRFRNFYLKYMRYEEMFCYRLEGFTTGFVTRLI